jgi:hypothetical protein
MSTTTAAAWRQAAQKTKQTGAEQLELPSGAVVMARRPGLETWMLRGRIPERLSGIVLALTGEGERRQLTVEEQAELGRFNREVVIATVVSPQVVEGAAGEGEISYGEIPDVDAEYLLAWAQRGAEVASLETFRERAGLSSAGPGGQDVRPEAEPDAGDHGPGAGA